MKNICRVALVYLSILQVLADEKPEFSFKKLPKEDVDKCLETSSFTRARLEELKELRKKNPDTTLPREFLCFIKCLGEKKGYISSSGDIVMDQLKASISPNVDSAKVEEFAKCAEGIGKMSSCDDMIKLVKCSSHK